MNNISEKLISVEEAKTALRCMRLCDLSEAEALETLDELAFRLRDVTTSRLVEDIIENSLSEVQRDAMKLHLYEGLNSTQIGERLGVSQASAYNALLRANNAIAKLMTPLIKYQNDICSAEIVPLRMEKLLEICAGRNGSAKDFCLQLRNLRLSNALSEERLATSLRISQRVLSEIESGKRLPSLLTATRYSALFEIEIDMNLKNGKGVYNCKKA